jgi:hypothetical protein
MAHRYTESPRRDRHDRVSVRSLAVLLALPPALVLLASPAGPALVMGLAAFALAFVAL